MGRPTGDGHAMPGQGGDMPMDDMRYPFRYEFARDYGLAVNFAQSSHVVLKAEVHRARGYNFDAYRAPSDAAARTTYVILGTALSF